MKTLGNIIWLIFAGFWSWLSWSIIGVILCITIVGIPFGLQCFKIGNFGLWPFGRKIETGSGFGSFLLNLLWIIFCGWELAVAHVLTAGLLCLTIIGIPFASQALKLAVISLMPFGARIYRI